MYEGVLLVCHGLYSDLIAVLLCCVVSAMLRDFFVLGSVPSGICRMAQWTFDA